MHTYVQSQKPIQETTPVQRTIGHRDVGRLAQSSTREIEASPRALPRFVQEFSRTPVHAVVGTDIQAKLRLGSPADLHEQEADRVAEHVLRMPGPPRQPPIQAHQAGMADQGASPSSGLPLNSATRGFMEARFGVEFSQVRTHTDGEAARACRKLNAQAFTHHQHIYFGAGRKPGNDQLTAHELTHVVQQTVGQPTKPGRAPDLQRKLELRPPGKGEASAFGRAQELVDRLNTISPAIQYELKGRELICSVKDAAALTHFDTVMKGFIDRAELVPMRLLTSKGYLGGGPIFADIFSEGYVDLDDLLADDIYSFQSDLLHFLTERFQVKDYARRIGTNLNPLFPKAHSAGKEAEAAQLRSLFKDPSVVFVYEETKPNDTWVNAFKSKTHGYWVFQVAHKSEREVAGGEMWVKKKDGTRVSMDDFRKERAAAAP